jgi:hypothetical protein
MKALTSRKLRDPRRKAVATRVLAAAEELHELRVEAKCPRNLSDHADSSLRYLAATALWIHNRGLSYPT